jgi:hypothetical protein
MCCWVAANVLWVLAGGERFRLAIDAVLGNSAEIALI